MEESHSALRRILSENFLFGDLSDIELSALVERVWIENIPSGSHIVDEGDQADALYIVVDGGVNVLKADNQFLSYLGEGGFFGEMALFTETAKRSATCIAAMDTTCAILRKEVLDEFVQVVPTAGVKIYRAIISALSERLEATSADLATLMSTHQVGRQERVNKVVEAAKLRREQEERDTF